MLPSKATPHVSSLKGLPPAKSAARVAPEERAHPASRVHSYDRDATREAAMAAERSTAGIGQLFGKEQARRAVPWSEVESRQPEIAQWRNLTRRAVAGNQAANNCYSKLRKAGLKRFEWFEVLVAVAVLAHGAHQRAKKGNRDWCSATKMGMSAKTLSRFPPRVRSLADEIERLNLHPLVGPEFWLFNPDLYCLRGRKLTGSLKKSLALWFERLPRLLRCHADYVEWQSKTMSQRVRAPKRPEVAGRIVVLDMLIQFVREETGKPHYAELSEILTATANTEGVNKDFSTGLLKMAVSRCQKLERK
jgi:hypothetical protein